MMYEFIRGPMAWTCFFTFIMGMLFQVVRFFLITKKVHPIIVRPPLNYNKEKDITFSKESLPQLVARLRVTIVGVDPVMTFFTVLFHISIFLLPIFLSEHNMLMDGLWEVSLCPYVLPEIVADIFTGIIMVCILFFLSRRIFLSRVRSISTIYDYLIIFLTAVPFATGFLAVHGFSDYTLLIILHVLSVNLIMLSLPFSKFVHSAFFFLSRFFVGSEYSFSEGSRRW
jgi:nitrate reductase gamma subunit